MRSSSRLLLLPLLALESLRMGGERDIHGSGEGRTGQRGTGTGKEFIRFVILLSDFVTSNNSI